MEEIGLRLVFPELEETAKNSMLQPTMEDEENHGEEREELTLS
jgi:hypothetical protein